MKKILFLLVAITAQIAMMANSLINPIDTDAESDSLTTYYVYEQYSIGRAFTMTPDVEYTEIELDKGLISICVEPESEQLCISFILNNEAFTIPVIDYKDNENGIRAFLCMDINAEGNDLPVQIFFSYNEDSGDAVPANIFMLIIHDPDAEFHEGYGFSEISRLI